MKRTLALLLAGIMVLCLAACGGSGGEESTAHQGAQDAAAQETDSPEASDTAETDPPEESGDEDLLGGVSGNTYLNTLLGLTCTLDESWVIADEETLGQLSGLAADVITDEDLADLVRSSGAAFAFYAATEDGLATMNICLENLGLLYGAILSEESYVEISMEQLGDALESIGMTDVTTEAETISLAGEDHAGIRIHAAYSGADFYELLICVKAGSYMSTVTLASYYEDLSEAMLAMFSAAE